MELKLLIEDFAYYGKYDGETLEERYVMTVNGDKDTLVSKLMAFIEDEYGYGLCDSKESILKDMSSFIDKAIAGDNTANVGIDIDATGGDWDEPTGRLTVISLYNAEAYKKELEAELTKKLEKYLVLDKQAGEIK